MTFQRVPHYPTYKSPDAVLEYGMDWSAILDADDIIESSVWESESALPISNTGIRGNITYCTLSGGTLGQQYKIFNKITTSGGLTDERFFVLKVQDIQVSFS